MNNEIFNQILDDVDHKSDLKTDDIPSLDLYMDQIMTLFDVHLSDNKRYESDKLLTKTMINNYSKEGLLKPIKGKKYSKEHILQMLLIYSLKNTISIQEIKKVLQPYHDEEDKIEPIYNQFLELKEELSHFVIASTKQLIETKKMNLDEKEHLTILLLLICSLSTEFKMIAEKTLDTFFIDQKK